MTIKVYFDNAGNGCTLTIYEDIESYYIKDDFIELNANNNQTTLYLATEYVLTMEVEK